MAEVTIVQCEAGGARCATATTPSPEREARVRHAFEAARARLEAAGMVVFPEGGRGELVLVLDAPLGAAVALSLADAADGGPAAYAGRPAILFRAGGAETHADVLVHELFHVWMRSSGAGDARWRIEAGRAVHESAMVHEGLADFVAGSLSGEAVVGEGLLAPGHTLRSDVRCPDGLTGRADRDGALVSSALWELGGAGSSPSEMHAVVAAVKRSSVEGSRGVEAWVDAMGTALAGETERLTRWDAIVETRGLRRCDEAIVVTPRDEGLGADGAGRVSAWRGDFLAAGTQHFGGKQVPGPVHFKATVSGAETLTVATRLGASGAVSVDWRSSDQAGRVIGRGTQPLEGWPSASSTLRLPGSSRTLTFALVNGEARDLGYNDVSLTRVSERATTSQTHALTEVPSPPPKPGGCWAGGGSDLLLSLLAVALWLRRR